MRGDVQVCYDWPHAEVSLLDQTRQPSAHWLGLQGRRSLVSTILIRRRCCRKVHPYPSIHPSSAEPGGDVTLTACMASPLTHNNHGLNARRQQLLPGRCQLEWTDDRLNQTVSFKAPARKFALSSHHQRASRPVWQPILTSYDSYPGVKTS